MIAKSKNMTMRVFHKIIVSMIKSKKKNLFLITHQYPILWTKTKLNKKIILIRNLDKLKIITNFQSLIQTSERPLQKQTNLKRFRNK